MLTQLLPPQRASCPWQPSPPFPSPLSSPVSGPGPAQTELLCSLIKDESLEPDMQVQILG